jgi:DNA helicase-2/ATP-dependent DNA helicase PcrA
LIKQIVIDEAQDYNELQYIILSKIFKKASFTILGDVNQTINPYHKYDSLEEMKDVLGNSRYIELNKAYRSSPEIMNYTGALIGKNVTSVRKSEKNEVKIKDVDKKDLFKELVTDVLELKEKGCKRICIITRSKNEADAIYDGLKSEVDNLVVIEDDMKDINTNTFVSPAYMAKGLEFDAVISYNDKENSYTEDDKYLYYVACTRAQHNLVVYNEPQKIKKLGGK